MNLAEQARIKLGLSMEEYALLIGGVRVSAIELDEMRVGDPSYRSHFWSVHTLILAMPSYATRALVEARGKEPMDDREREALGRLIVKLEHDSKVM